MARIIKLKESDLNNIVKRIIKENKNGLITEGFKWKKLFKMLLKAAIGALIGSIFSQTRPNPGDLQAIEDFVRDLADARQDPEWIDTPALLELEEKILQIRDAAMAMTDMPQSDPQSGGRGGDMGLGDDFGGGDPGPMEPMGTAMMESRQIISEGWLSGIGKWFKNRWDDLVDAFMEEWWEMQRPPSDPQLADSRPTGVMESYRRDAMRKRKQFRIAQNLYENRKRYPTFR